jgi:hypothetical protein
MKKLLEISAPCQCILRKPAFTERHILTGERQIVGYSCSHPECTEEFLKHHNIDFLPCNNAERFPKRCFLQTAKIKLPDNSIFISPEVQERIAKTMDINSKEGTPVRLQMKDGEVFGGYDGDKKLALKFLKPDTIYHVLCTDIGGFHTDVYLEEVPNVGFNSVMFEHVKE